MKESSNDLKVMTGKNKLIDTLENGQRLNLYDPVGMPRASAFLWNPKMMIHLNCRGFAVSQFMQPEPAKYAHAPNLEAKTFMQPEQPYYAHHAGRFCYVKDLDHKELFSAPYEPVKAPVDEYCFSAGQSDVIWTLKKNDLQIEMKLHLTRDDIVELWTIRIINKDSKRRKLQLFPYFPVGYMSWMNQSGVFNNELNAIICSSVSPYQKYQDYDKVKEFKDNTFLMADTPPDAYEANQEAFEGEGGLHKPSAIQSGQLKNGEARYETPACVFQYDLELEADECREFKFAFGPAKDIKEIKAIREKYIDDANGFKRASIAYSDYLKEGESCLTIETPDKKLDNFVNFWLPRQVYYHGETNRLCTDPQTRNYLQDNMGMGYLKPEVSRKAFQTALEQQKSSGAMPDGVLIVKGAELKYINQVPHTDHCVWLPICLKAYLDETNDHEFLSQDLRFADSKEMASVAEHINRAMSWLLQNRDERGLNYINQGDWCDPMNMVGYKGKGVSGWLSLATSYALQVWMQICETYDLKTNSSEFTSQIKVLNKAVNEHLWDGNWYGRGITDDNVTFGISSDPEGRIFLNPQAWSMLSHAADPQKVIRIIDAVKSELEGPYGVEMLSPSFTAMREDIGRVTQKHPGSAENGSVYNHAASFYIYALYGQGIKEEAYRLIEKMIPGPEEEDLIQRGQLPVFIPNYYRGASRQFPRTAGRSSQLFNTGTVHWIFRSLIDGLFGVKGEKNGMRIDPQLPEKWQSIRIQRRFRGAVFNIRMEKVRGISTLRLHQDGVLLPDNMITKFEKGHTYDLIVDIPGD